MRILSAEENAREEGRDCAVAWASRRDEKEGTHQEWRQTRRAKIVERYESGELSSLCSSDLPREHFLALLEEWDEGFDRAIEIILGSPEVRAAEIKRIASRASVMCSLLGVTNIIPEARQLNNLRTCSDLAAEIVSDLSVLTGDPE
jgi:hypothetical protein